MSYAGTAEESQTLEARGLDRIISVSLGAGRRRILPIVAALICSIAVLDWSTGDTVSLGILYILPAMLAAVVLRPIESFGVALLCSFLRSCFDTPGSKAELTLRFLFASAAYFVAGLFVTALVRNRQLVLHHLALVQREQELRLDAEQQLRILVESSPAAILTLDASATILAANAAAASLFAAFDHGNLIGMRIGRYLPVLADALQLRDGSESFRTAAQCYGYRCNGEVFLANTWFSTYRTDEGMRLAAIIVDSSEEMREREEQNLLQLNRYSRIAAAGISHEVRNLCSAVALVTGSFAQKHRLEAEPDVQAILRLIQSLQSVADRTLRWHVNEASGPVPLQDVLDSLRIITEPEWADLGGEIAWPASPLPRVIADAGGLLQAFLNVVHNSARAVRECDRKELRIAVRSEEHMVSVEFVDSGAGVLRPEVLFQPFLSGGEGAGLGLYIARSLVRSYGGELRYEPGGHGARFVFGLQAAEVRP